MTCLNNACSNGECAFGGKPCNSLVPPIQSPSMTPEEKEQLRKEWQNQPPETTMFDFMVSKIESKHKSFIDSFREKIEKELNSNKILGKQVNR